MDKEFTKELMGYLIEVGSTIGLSLLLALAILVIGRQIVKILIRVISVALEKSKTEDTVRIFVTNLLNTLLMIVVFIAAINQ
ncbi:uncharacterized protein METZ01_LOCUS227697, partial [marine metagenome]